MRVFIVLLIIAILLTIMSIIGFCKGKGALDNTAFYGEKKEIKIPTEDYFLGGCVAATGAGNFIITSSGSESIKVGSTWDAYGLDKVYWGERLEFSGFGSVETQSKGKLRCEVSIPSLDLNEPTLVKGYLLVASTTAVGTGKDSGIIGTFCNVIRNIKSEEFGLWLYPSEKRETVKLYTFFREGCWLTVIVWILVVAAYSDYMTKRWRKEKQQNKK